MLLSKLMQGLISIPHSLDRTIQGMTQDSREASSGYLFVTSGDQYIEHAISQGVCVVLQNTAEVNAFYQTTSDCLIIFLPQLTEKLFYIASRYYQSPAKHLRLIGVTGTNGKTSCTHFLASVLENLHVSCGLMGTLGSGFYNKLEPSAFTTPNVIEIQRVLRRLVDQGAQMAAMEVSSHGIDQSRIQGLQFEVGVFTNLAREHLDYHGNIETYARVKQRFLEEDQTKKLVINVDDKKGSQWMHALSLKKPVTVYGLHCHSSLPSQVSFVWADHIQAHAQGITASIASSWGQGEVHLPLLGTFNLSNALAVLAVLCLLDIPFEEALAQLYTLKTVPGRMQLIDGVDQSQVVIDYAHKPEALQKVLEAVRANCKGRLICVFGCGGDRDKGKRPEMAAVAESLADEVILTNDNPRHESPIAIAEDAMKGFKRPDQVLLELDRAAAIRMAIQHAQPEDWILVAGKGAEFYQQIGDQKFPFSDLEKAQEFLAEKKNVIMAQ